MRRQVFSCTNGGLRCRSGLGSGFFVLAVVQVYVEDGLEGDKRHEQWGRRAEEQDAEQRHRIGRQKGDDRDIEPIFVCELHPPGALAMSHRVWDGASAYYSITWMFFFLHISFSIFGQTVALTSPMWAFLSRSMKVWDWPMPPPMLSGI